ncbi:hypothetical protein [Vibrio sp. WXL103]|uniref:hypothetical protein n=1 Tax=Vibrio sp. WXL103 TaxID=3450710 RepID=UPI003EC61F82
MNKKFISVVVAGLVASPVVADTLSNPQIGVVLDGYYQNGHRVKSEREEGFGLGHTELNLSASIDDKFYGSLTTVLESHGDETELLLEEAFIETLSMPYGLSVRGGRFLSDFGYLNNQHMHEDSFVERPIAYRTFLGSHYFDDGVRLNIVLPTDTYVKFGAEALSGEKLSNDEDGSDIGVYTANFKVGSDFSDSSSWQFGLSYLRNENAHDDHDDHGHHDHSHDHDHDHGAAVTGTNLYGADLVWKWAPNGNYKYNSLTLAAEYLYLDEVAGGHHAPDNISGYYVSGVYRFSPSWSAGLRYGQSDSYDDIVHNDHSHMEETEAKEFDAMIAWDSSHFGTIRAQYSRVEYETASGRDEMTDDVFTLQYVMTFGAHGAHAF